MSNFCYGQAVAAHEATHAAAMRERAALITLVVAGNGHRLLHIPAYVVNIRL